MIGFNRIDVLKFVGNFLVLLILQKYIGNLLYKLDIYFLIKNFFKCVICIIDKTFLKRNIKELLIFQYSQILNPNLLRCRPIKIN